MQAKDIQLLRGELSDKMEKLNEVRQRNQQLQEK
jgi:hypothetical protein